MEQKIAHMHKLAYPMYYIYVCAYVIYREYTSHSNLQIFLFWPKSNSHKDGKEILSYTVKRVKYSFDLVVGASLCLKTLM